VLKLNNNQFQTGEPQSYNNDVNDLGELNSVLFYVSSIRVSCSRETLLARKIKTKFQFFYTPDELNKSETRRVLLNYLLNIIRLNQLLFELCLKFMEMNLYLFQITIAVGQI